MTPTDTTRFLIARTLSLVGPDFAGDEPFVALILPGSGRWPTLTRSEFARWATRTHFAG